MSYPGKVVTAKAGCGLTGNQAGISPLDEGFFHGLVSHNWPGGFVPDAAPRHQGNAAKQEIHMRLLNCRLGDLAITDEAFNPINIGSIVRVLHKHHNQSALSVEPDDFLLYEVRHLWLHRGFLQQCSTPQVSRSTQPHGIRAQTPNCTIKCT